MDYHLRVCIGFITRVLVMLGTENFLKEKDKKEKEKQRQGRLDAFGGLRRKLFILFEMQNYY